MTTNTIELKKKIEAYEQEMQKKKLIEKLLVVKTDIEDELKTQVCSFFVYYWRFFYAHICSVPSFLPLTPTFFSLQQISDLKQELNQVRKSENNLIQKCKRLNSNYGKDIIYRRL